VSNYYFLDRKIIEIFCVSLIFIEKTNVKIILMRKKKQKSWRGGIFFLFLENLLKKKDQQFPISRSQSVISKLSNVISSTRKVQLPPALCDFTRIVVILSLTTRSSVIYTRRVKFLHAECNFNTYGCDFNTHKISFYTQSKFSTRRVEFSHAECNFYTQSVIFTRRV
jgi:hypothetical protein